MMEFRLPATLRDGRYVLGERLGQGGMAVVVVAHDTALGVDRAVKLLQPHGKRRATLRRRLKAEARAMARLNHPNILAIHDVGVEDGIDYVVMDLALGGSLHDLVRDGPLDPWVACSLMIQVLSALGAAHAQGIVHRDVKPHNVLMDLNGRAMLADFGIALLAGEERRTRTGVAMGSLAYMPPEQRLDAAGVGPRADLYAVGSTLYALITRRNPVDLFLAGPGSERWNGVPEPLRPILLRAVKMDPGQRWPDAGSFAHALLEALRERGMDLPSLHGVGASLAGADRTAGSLHAPTVGERTREALSFLDERLPTVGPVDLPPLEAPPSTSTIPEETRWVALPMGLLVVGAVAVLAMLRPVEKSEVRSGDYVEFLKLGAERRGASAQSGEMSGAAGSSTPEGAEVGVEPPGPSVPAAGSATSREAAPVRAEPAVKHPVSPPSRGASGSVGRGASPVEGVWVGSLNGIVLRAELRGAAGAIRGTMRSTFGTNQTTSRVRGVYHADRRALELTDLPGTPDAATYRLTLSPAGDVLSGEVRTPRGMRRLILKRSR